MILNEGRKGKKVKKVGEVFPHVGAAILAQALVIKTVTKKRMSKKKKRSFE